MARKRSRPGTAEQTSGQRHRRSPARGLRGTGRSRPWGITRYPPAGRWTRRVARTENRAATPPVRSDWSVRRRANRVTTARAAATPHGLRRGMGHDHEHRDRTGSAVVAWPNRRERCDQQQRPMKPPAHPAVVTRTKDTDAATGHGRPVTDRWHRPGSARSRAQRPAVRDQPGLRVLGTTTPSTATTANFVSQTSRHQAVGRWRARLGTARRCGRRVIGRRRRHQELPVLLRRCQHR